MDELTQWLTSEFGEVLSDKSLKTTKAKTEALIEVVNRLHASCAGLDFRKTHAGIHREKRNDGDLTLHTDANGNLEAIEIIEGEHIADLRFWI